MSVCLFIRRNANFRIHCWLDGYSQTAFVLIEFRQPRQKRSGKCGCHQRTSEVIRGKLRSSSRRRRTAKIPMPNINEQKVGIV
jgi:hypothetical protein